MKKEKILVLSLGVLVVLLFVALSFVLVGVFSKDNVAVKNKKDVQNNVAKNNTTSDYKAVFLINNQVYFGKIKESSDKKLVLTNVYYIQVNQVDKQVKNAKGVMTTEKEPRADLISLVNDPHGPKDELVLNYSNVLYTEDLRADSSVLSAIEQAETSKNNPQATNPQQ